MAALCHDLGHLPFSHAAELELLPPGWDHEQITKNLILGQEMTQLWDGMIPRLNPSHIAKIAVGPEHFKDEVFTDVEAVLSEIIIGDAFGVDRMDYLLRDSHHTGVAYGRFDHFRLIDTLRLLPPPNLDNDQDSIEPQLGVEQGGLRSAEALTLARYFMFSQVYFHPVRRAYDIHLKDFLGEWLVNGRFPISTEEFLSITDAEVVSGMLAANRDPESPGHQHAKRLLTRDHFRVLWERNEGDLQTNPRAGKLIFLAAVGYFGPDAVRRDVYSPSSPVIDFPVLLRRGTTESAQSSSQVLQNVPTAAFDYVFVQRDLLNHAERWLRANIDGILSDHAGMTNE